MYNIKAMAKRGTALAGAVGLLAGIGTSALPSLASADALNPLTKRSLTLSSSSPGWSYTDGSGNSTYAPPNSGANGQKTGNTFAFHNSTANGGVKTLSFQYCTTSAGNCTAPGNDSGTAPSRGSDDSSHSDLNVVTSSPAEVGSSNFATVIDSTTGAVKAVPGVTNPLNPSDSTGQYAAHAIAGNFVVMYDNSGTWTQSTGWSMTAVNNETPSAVTGKNNYIILSKASGTLNVPFDTPLQVIFFGTTNNYITNPGAGAFFVKINTYNVAYDGTTVTTSDLEPATDNNVVDGGVTVANVMNQSIQITTKVLETMDFSVGTVDPDVLSSADGDNTTASTYEAAVGHSADNNATLHGPCDPILMGLTPSESSNVLQLGDQNAESSLSTTRTYATHSYWRLSSNSSAGATVYYSGHTLSNTEGDQIQPIGVSKQAPHHGGEQFGLALDNASTGSSPYNVSYTQGTYENGDDNGQTSLASFHTDMTSQNDTYHDPQLAPLVAQANYSEGTGIFDAVDGSVNTKFAFDPNSDTIPTALATESSQVVDCVTAKMRYVANIAATTPAGIYTTKINYIAAPQY